MNETSALLQIPLADALDHIIDHRGLTPGKLGTDFTASGVVVISARNIQNGNIVLDESTRFVSRATYERWMPVKIQVGDVLMTSEAPLGQPALVRESTEYCLGQRLYCLSPNTSILDGQYLYYLIKSADFQSKLIARSTGSTAKGIRQAELVKIPVSLPSLQEQKHVAAILSTSDTVRTLRWQAINKLDQLLSSTFLEMFGNPVHNPHSWRQVQFDEVLQAIEGGWSPVCLDRPALPDEWGVLKLGAITPCVYLDSENKALPNNVSPRTTLEVKPGDLLFSRKNTRDLVAACALVEDTREKLMIPDLIFRFRLKEPWECLPEYLWGLLTSSR